MAFEKVTAPLPATGKTGGSSSTDSIQSSASNSSKPFPRNKRLDSNGGSVRSRLASDVGSTRHSALIVVNDIKNDVNAKSDPGIRTSFADSDLGSSSLDFLKPSSDLMDEDLMVKSLTDCQSTSILPFLSNQFPPFKSLDESQQITLLKEAVNLTLLRIGGVKNEHSTTSELLKGLADVFVYGLHMNVTVDNYTKSLKEELDKVNLLKEQKDTSIPKTSLKLTLISGRNLAPKDSSGFSDPYALIGVLDLDECKYTDQMQKSEVKKQTLNPEWNQTFILPVEDWKNQKIVADFWDFDEETTWDSLKSKRLFAKAEENENNDDFLGRLLIPLAHIDTEGITKWYPLAKRSKRSKISGDVHIKLEINIENRAEENTDEAVSIYDSLDAIFTQANGGTFEPAWSMLLSQYAIRNNLTKEVTTTIRWNNLVRLSLIGLSNFKILRTCLDSLQAMDLTNNESSIITNIPNNNLRTEYKLSFSSLHTLFELSIEKLQDTFPLIEQESTYNFHEFFELMSTVYQLEYPRTLLNSPKFMNIVKEAINKNALWRMKVCNKLAKANSTPENFLITEINLLETELSIALDNALESPLHKVLKIDYLLILLKAFVDRINESSRKLLINYSKNDKELNPKIFDVYYTLKNIVEKYMVLYGSFAAHELKNYHNEFTPFVSLWLEHSGKTVNTWVQNAIKVDNNKEKLEGELYSTSVLDVFSGITQTYTFLNQLKWPDPVYFTIFVTMFAQMVCESVAEYVRGMRNEFETNLKKSKTESKPDDVNMIDPNQCTILNNLNQIHARMNQTFDLIEYPTLIKNMREIDDTSFEPPIKTLFAEVEVLVGEQISFCMDKLAQKMSKPIMSYIRGAVGLTEKNDSLISGLLKNNFNINGASPVEKAEVDEAISPFMDFLNENLAILSQELYHDLFRSILHRVWIEILESSNEILTPDVNSLRLPLNVNQASFLKNMIDILHDYFYADGDGIKAVKLDCNEYFEIIDKFGMFEMGTDELVERYFLLEAENQQNAGTGVEEHDVVDHGAVEMEIYLNKSTVCVKLVEMENLPAMDENGLSDPYAVLKLIPKREHPANSCKSTIKQETLNPKYNEEFTFDIGTCDYKKLSLQLVVYDYDFIGGDDYIGEVVVPFKDINLSAVKYRNVWKVKQYSASNAAMLALNGHLEVDVTVNESKKMADVLVKRGVNLPAMDANGLSDPFVEVRLLPMVAKKPHQTKTKYKTLNPEFNEKFTLGPYEDKQKTMIQLSVYDYDYVGTNDYIGEALITLETIPNGETTSANYNLYRSSTSIIAKFIYCVLAGRNDSKATKFCKERKYLMASKS